MLVRKAKDVWNVLNGIICVHKPADVSCRRVAHTIVTKICQELNEMECRPPTDYVEITGSSAEQLTVQVRPSYADDPSVVGPRYQIKDARCTWSNYLGANTSGVLLLGINGGTKLTHNIRASKLARTYRIKGKFGENRDNYYKDGKVVEKSTYRHVNSARLENVLMSMQTTHQRKMFEACGVNLQSQTAYDMAVQGLVRPTISQIPILYGIKCTEFESPNFTLEILCVNEYENYLKALIYEIGNKLHAAAHCTGLQCIRHSHFDVDIALLHKHWTLQNIVTNLTQCTKIMDRHGEIKHQRSPVLLTA